MKILVLGATGNVGQQVLKAIEELNHTLVGFSFNTNLPLAKKINSQNNVCHIYSPTVKKLSSVNSYKSLIKKTNPDMVVNAISGFAGLNPTIVTLKLGKTLINANKESLVVAGPFIQKLVNKHSGRIIPIDSEHAAIHELITKFGNPKKIYITGTGGPFYRLSNYELSKITTNEALKHPKWKMGKKITIDSSTHMNKCLEMIEAFWLFNTSEIYPFYHPEAMIHSMICVKSKVYGIESKPNMINPIKYALSGCKASVQGKIIEIDLKKSKYKLEQFNQELKPIQWAREIINSKSIGKSIILNAANELAVEYFLEKKITYPRIYDVIEFALRNIDFIEPKFFFQIHYLNWKTKSYILKHFFNQH